MPYELLSPVSHCALLAIFKFWLFSIFVVIFATVLLIASLFFTLYPHFVFLGLLVLVVWFTLYLKKFPNLTPPSPLFVTAQCSQDWSATVSLHAHCSTFAYIFLFAQFSILQHHLHACRYCLLIRLIRLLVFLKDVVVPHPKGLLCRIKGDISAEMEYNIYKCVFH